jgi:hypothetical protein
MGFQNIQWGFRPPVLGLSLGVGVLIAAIGIFFLKKKNYLIFYCLGGCFISLFLASNLSSYLWDSIGYLKMFQFPWRFIAGATVAGVFAITLFINSLPKKIGILIFLVLFGLVFINFSYLRPSGYNYIAVYTADDNCSTTTWAQEYLPKWTAKCLPKPSKKKTPLTISVNKNSTISNTIESRYGRLISFRVSNVKDASVLIRRYFFPGWKVSIDDKLVSIKPSEKEGLILVNVPKGNHVVRVSWDGTPIQSIGNWISIVVFCLSLFLIVAYKKTRKLL